eukprot:940907-Alexandrium_andersonii.AAC.1
MDPADRVKKFLGMEVYGPVITPFPGVASVDRSFLALSMKGYVEMVVDKFHSENSFSAKLYAYLTPGDDA